MIKKINLALTAVCVWVGIVNLMFISLGAEIGRTETFLGFVGGTAMAINSMLCQVRLMQLES